MIFLARADQIAAVQDEAHAQARERVGYTRVSYATYRVLWQAQDARARAGIAREDARAAAAKELARIVGKLPGKVYPVKVSEG